MSELLLELYSEEIPAFMQKDAEDSYLDIFTKIFVENEISPKIKVYAGPRRITIHITHLPKFILSKEVEIKGPNIKASSTAIEGFCKTYNTNKATLITKLINDQLYYFFTKKIPERNIRDVLTEILPIGINKHIWPKSMYWSDYKIKWVRPLQNILCVFDGKILPLTFAHLIANDITYGHRLTNYKAIKITNFHEYITKLLENEVILERDKRKEIIKNSLLEIANQHNLQFREDENLIEEVAGLSEHPVAMLGQIPTKFIKLPKEVLVSSMRTHQKYFCLFDKEGNFAPYFIFISNGKFKSTELVIKGNEKVLSARLSDALYFYNQDLLKTLESKLLNLEQVTFHAKLGNVKAKIDRIVSICRHLDSTNKELLIAAKLCKSDLISEMVGEFPELQGIMGYYYALNENYKKEVALAIRDHYKPQGPADVVPHGNAALLAIADKIDNLSGLIYAGEIPTGSGDPYALRRQALGIIRIIIENNLVIDINELIHFSTSLYGDNTNLVSNFFKERLKFYFKNDYEISLINAVLDQELKYNLMNIISKLNALQKFLAGDAGADLLNIYKRISNILSDKKINGKINSNIFSSVTEKELFDAISEISQQFNTSIQAQDYSKSLNLLKSLLVPINNFFDNVLVNDENHEIASNRLLLLQNIYELFQKIANFDYL